jgi:hypothetical protein
MMENGLNVSKRLVRIASSDDGLARGVFVRRKHSARAFYDRFLDDFRPPSFLSGFRDGSRGPMRRNRHILFTSFHHSKTT